MQVETGLRLLWEHRRAMLPSAQSFEIALGAEPKMTNFRIPLSPECPFHEELPANCVLQAANSDISVREMLGLAARDRPGEPALTLDWPLCVSARCRACGHRWPAMKRLAVLRRSGVCPKCLSGPVAAERSVHRIGLDSDLADYSLGELGMPDRHLYTIEFLRGAKP
jgi:hypothetical protein